MTYQELKNQQPILEECFFAFDAAQFIDGIKKTGIKAKKICSAGSGLYGTKEGIDKLLNDYAAIEKQIAEQCDPQEMYDYEYNNHECDYIGDDEEAIDMVIGTFGVEKAKTVKRKHGYKPIQ